MRIVPLTLKQAERFLRAHGRHYKTSASPLCAIGVADEAGLLHGAVILGRRDERTAELTHIYADGSSQAYTLLYGNAWRTLKALGYEQTIL